MYSIPMAIVDFVPVLLFSAAAVILQRDFYNKMSKGVFALFAAGTIDVAMAGFLKALYKLLYAAVACDFEPLNKMFFPVQAIGFLLAGIAVARVAFGKTGNEKMMSVAVAPVLYKGTFVFVGFMVAGLGAMDAGLFKIAVIKKRPVACVLFVLSFVFCLMMGYLASKDFEQSYMNWIAEALNILGEGSLFAGSVILHKAGLADEKN